MGTRIQDPIPEWATHLAVIHKDGTVETGSKDDLLPAVSPHQKSPPHTGHQPIMDHQLDKVLIDMQGVNVAYGDRKVCTIWLLF